MSFHRGSIYKPAPEVGDHPGVLPVSLRRRQKLPSVALINLFHQQYVGGAAPGPSGTGTGILTLAEKWGVGGLRGEVHFCLDASHIDPQTHSPPPPPEVQAFGIRRQKDT